VPSWAKDIKIGNKLINTRSETILEKPPFRKAAGIHVAEARWHSAGNALHCLTH
jgi:hypothetical protein